MATKVECDRCHKAVEGDGAKRGFVIKRDYCEICVKKIDKMLGEIDDLHNWVAQQWSDNLLQIHEKYETKRGLLPDVGV